MTHQVLARKWRPRTFADVTGQQHVVRALANALVQQRLHHAYLLTGTRGVGKTTLARILAKCLNCETGITDKPCLTCSTCESIEQGRFVDLIEIDAASRTRVEDTRELLDNVQYMPTMGRYKIYLIDEVHMLSNHSFNALLKTLEEPPAHVIFILATTNPEKLPVTVLSRCLQFQLKSMTAEQVASRLTTILEAENIAFNPNALPLIAKAANGSMRDALSLLDQVIAFSQGNVTEQEVTALIGGVNEATFIALLQAIAENSGAALVEIIQQLQFEGIDFENVLDGLLERLHQISLAQLIAEYAISTELKNFATVFSKEQVQLYYQICLHGKRDLALSPSTRLGFEMTLLRMLAFAPAVNISHPAPIPTEKKTADFVENSKTPVASPLKPVANEAPAPSSPSEAKVSTPLSEPPPIAGMLAWPELIQQLPLSGPAKLLANYSQVKAFENDHLQLEIDGSQASMLSSKSQQKLAEILSGYFQKTIHVTITPGASGIACPANLAKQAAENLHRSAVSTLQNDPGLNLLTQRFNATINPESVKPILTDNK